MIQPHARGAFIQLLRMMQAEAEWMAKEFEREIGQPYQSQDNAQQAIAAIASKQAAICRLLITMIEE